MRVLFAGALTGVMIVTIGCVIRTQHTIDAHIRVDIRHIQEQADAVLDYIEGRTESIPLDGDAAGDVSWRQRFLEVIHPVPEARASESLQETSPEVNRLAQRMRERHPELQALKNDGCAGEDNRGYAALRDCGALDTQEARQAAQELIDAENEDRQALYEEIARLNAERNVPRSQVERIFAQRRLERASSGEIFQLPPSGQAFDRFRNSARGQRLGDQCVPNAWVRIP